MATKEREINEPVDLAAPDGRRLNPDAVGWSRRPLHRANLRGSYNAPVQNDRLTRGGPLMGQPAWGSIGAGLSNNFTSSARWDVGFMWGNLNQGNDWFMDFGVEFDPSDRLALRVAPGVSWMTDRRQYYTTRDRDSDRTYGERYVFSTVDQKTVSMQLRANYSFNPDLNLELYAEPFASSGKFTRFGELPEAQSFDLREYGTDGRGLCRGSDGLIQEIVFLPFSVVVNIDQPGTVLVADDGVEHVQEIPIFGVVVVQSGHAPDAVDEYCQDGFGEIRK